MRKTAKGRKNKRTRKFRQTRKQKGGWPFGKKKTKHEPEKEMSNEEIDADQLNRQREAIDKMRMDNPNKDIDEIYAELKMKQLNDMNVMRYKVYPDKMCKIVFNKDYYEDEEKYCADKYTELKTNPKLLWPLSDEQIAIINKEQGEYMSVEGGGQKRRTNFKKKTRRGKRTIRR
jgi:hypothetical protein